MRTGQTEEMPRFGFADQAAGVEEGGRQPEVTAEQSRQGGGQGCVFGAIGECVAREALPCEVFYG
jgi:hypothetical protein